MFRKTIEDSPSCSQEDKSANHNMEYFQAKGAIPKTKHNIDKHQNGKKNNVKISLINDKSHSQSSKGTSKFNTFSKCFSKDRKKTLVIQCEPRHGVGERNVTMGDSFPYNGRVSSPSSTSSEDSDLSISDDGCIYTYKADTPIEVSHTFYNGESAFATSCGQRRSGSSPEMDYLEMDFDPGPCGDADSESSSSHNDQVTDHPSEDIRERTDENISQPKDTHLPVAKQESCKKGSLNSEISHQKNIIAPSPKPLQEEIEFPWSCSLSQRTKASKHLRIIKRHMGALGELNSIREVIEGTTFDYIGNSRRSCPNVIIDQSQKIMHCSEEMAKMTLSSQSAPSYCGTTAVFNTLLTLREEHPTSDSLRASVKTKMRKNCSPLAEYLLSRSEAGCTHREMIEGLEKLSNGRIYARFFSMYPERCVNLQDWLGFWIREGAVPIATLNIQKSLGALPDSWHHQMIFGVDPVNVYLSNPVECVDGSELWHQLVSESVLLIKREDVLQRWNPKTDIVQLERIQGKRWKDLNVVGQVAKMVRESQRASRDKSTLTTHLKIPAVYRSGITIAIKRDSMAFELLRECPELPVLNLSSAEV